MRGKSWRRRACLSIGVNFKVFSFVMAYDNKKVGDIFGYHITFCVITQSFNSQNSQYLEIFGFNLIDFMSFGDKRNAGIIQYFTKSIVVFFFPEN